MAALGWMMLGGVTTVSLAWIAFASWLLFFRKDFH